VYNIGSCLEIKKWKKGKKKKEKRRKKEGQMWFSITISALSLAVAFFVLGTLKPGFVRGILAGLNAGLAVVNFCLFIMKLTGNM